MRACGKPQAAGEPILKSPIITLVIPTRERADVLQHALQTVVKQDYENLRILVCDNCSSDNTRVVVEAVKDKRLSYCNPGKRLSMTENWNYALSQITDEGFVCFMGDDDGVLPGAIALAADILTTNNLKVLRATAADYHWPTRNKKTHGYLSLNIGSKFEVRSSTQWLDKVLRGGAPYSNLPVIYNGGFVHTDVLARLKHAGKHLHSSIPDVYSGVAIASVVESFGFTDVPLFLNGASQHSTGTSTFAVVKTSEYASISPAQRFVDEGNIPFHPSLPMLANGHYPRSTRIMAYDAYLLSSFLRESSSAITAQDQLTQFLASSTMTRHAHEIDEWCRLFAARNGLSYKQAKLAAVPISFLRYARRKIKKRMRQRRAIILNAPEWPLLTVDEAVQFAGSKTAAIYNDLRQRSFSSFSNPT